MLAASAAALPALAALPARAAGGHTALGLVIHSFGFRGREKGFSDPIQFVEYARTLGAGGVQVGIGERDDAYADDLRARAAAASVVVEGSSPLPRDEADVARFAAEMATARRAGVKVVRTVTLGTRRYETFDTDAAFRRFADRAFRSLKLAAPVVEKHKIRLAVENHKDWRTDEFLGLLKRVGSDHVGVCLDTGNNLSLLEDPMETVEALAPSAFTVHFKDVAVEEDRDGFLMAEVPLGTGLLDLPKMVGLVRKAHPEARFNLEMITRDPLKIPCLTERYWATFPDLPGRHLARALAYVRAHPPRTPLPRVSRLAAPEQLRIEDENIRRSLDHGRERLGL